MYKKILSINSQASGGLNKAENATSTMTLKDLKIPSPLPSASNVHHHHQQQQQQQSTSTIERYSVDVSDESAPSNFATEAKHANGSDIAICERPLATPDLATSHHVPTSLSPPPPLLKIESDESSLEHNTFPTHKSINHHTNCLVDENLENKQQNFVSEEDDVWRPW